MNFISKISSLNQSFFSSQFLFSFHLSYLKLQSCNLIHYVLLISRNASIQIYSTRDVSTGATSATVVAPKFSDTLTIYPQGGGEQILPTITEVATRFSHVVTFLIIILLRRTYQSLDKPSGDKGNLPVVFNKNHYFGLGFSIPVMKPKLVNTFGWYGNRYQNHI